ncbi:hypothetical protein Dda_3811 [Drechslerella dactyloides]|uniref:Haloacid dehalogenase n=1 Tax=Drechslerella dactyloides TaxID=74499 RepID=A0AAD6NK92_DREDA|nr:hypothetical protein Dda_3811 [Drechslerella dactyloides]
MTMAPESTLAVLPEAVVFDVFGTVFDWRSPVKSALEHAISQKLALAGNSTNLPPGSPDLSTPSAIRKFAATFAEQWRDSYKDFVVTQAEATSPSSTTNINQCRAPYKTIDAHHLASLRNLLASYHISHLFSAQETQTLSRIWHFLTPWPDSAPGIAALRSRCPVATLSNGNVKLLLDLQRHSGVVFDVTLSAQLWRSYKPAKEVYIGACEVLGVGSDDAWAEYCETDVGEREDEEAWRAKQRGKVAMVAAHIGDLRAAKDCGLATIYIHRPGEDDEKGSEDAEAAYRASGEDWIDMWVRHDEGGIQEVARRLAKLAEK